VCAVLQVDSYSLGASSILVGTLRPQHHPISSTLQLELAAGAAAHQLLTLATDTDTQRIRPGAFIMDNLDIWSDWVLPVAANFGYYSQVSHPSAS
jgi:hypothetical protein